MMRSSRVGRFNIRNESFFSTNSLLVLDGFDRQYQASVHFPLTSVINTSQQHPNKLWEGRDSKPGFLGEQARMLLFDAA